MSFTPKLYKNGVTAAVDQKLPPNPICDTYGPRLRITACFDLEISDGNREDSLINTAIADIEITIREKPITNWETQFTTRKYYLLKNDGSGQSLQNHPVGNSVLPVLQLAITCGAAALGPTAPLALVILAAGLPSAAELLFKSFEITNKKQEDISHEIKIRYSKWYSFRRWLRKPCILGQDLEVVLSEINQHGAMPTSVEYEVTVKAETGQVIHHFLPIVIGTYDIAVNSKFMIDWKK